MSTGGADPLVAADIAVAEAGDRLRVAALASDGGGWTERQDLLQEALEAARAAVLALRFAIVETADRARAEARGR